MLPAIALLSLLGCAQAPSDCPPIVEYSPAFQAQLADEVQQQPEGAATVRALLDYAALRDEIRACRK